jgi:hypothetical protein
MAGSKSFWRTLVLSLAVVLLVITAVAVCVFVPLLDPPKPPWPIFCETGEITQRITVFEYVWLKKTGKYPEAPGLFR